MGPTPPRLPHTGEDAPRVVADGLLQSPRAGRPQPRHTRPAHLDRRFSTVLDAYVNPKARTLLHPPTFHPFRGPVRASSRPTEPRNGTGPFPTHYGQFGRAGTRVGPTGLEWVRAKTLRVRFRLLLAMAFTVALGF